MVALEVSAIRLVPWDIGGAIGDEYLEALQSSKDINLAWKVENRTDQDDDGLLTKLELKFYEDRAAIRLFIYRDGVALFEIRERPMVYESPLDFDSEVHAALKKSVQRQLLTGKHAHSVEICKTVQALQELNNCRLKRKSASTAWENSAFSYAFTYHFVKTSDTVPLHDICKKCAPLLYPVHLPSRVNIHTWVAVDLTHTYKSSDPHSRQDDEQYELRPGMFMQSSWATATVIGNIDDDEVVYFERLQRNIQRTWFYCYIADDQLRALTEQLRQNVPTKDLALMGEIAGDAKIVALRVADLRSSMATQGEISAYEALTRTSRLTLHSSHLARLADVFESRLAGYIEQRRLSSTRTIEATIIFLAIVSATADFSSILKDDSSRDWQLKFLAIIACVSLLAWILVRGVGSRRTRIGTRSVWSRDIRDINLLSSFRKYLKSRRGDG